MTNKLWLLLLSICWIGLQGMLRAETKKTEVVTREFLKAHGVAIHKTRNNTPMASQAIDLAFDGASGLGKFEAAECVVLTEALPKEQIAAFEAKPDETLVERRVRTTKMKTTFLVRGQELGRAYLAFIFSADGASSQSESREYILTLDRRGSTPAPSN